MKAVPNYRVDDDDDLETHDSGDDAGDENGSVQEQSPRAGSSQNGTDEEDKGETQGRRATPPTPGNQNMKKMQDQILQLFTLIRGEEKKSPEQRRDVGRKVRRRSSGLRARQDRRVRGTRARGIRGQRPRRKGKRPAIEDADSEDEDSDDESVIIFI